jgi:prepilin-type N-terminal cleavage/methylation domain-containing protein
MYKYRQNTKGFTLMELMAVMVIIGALFGIIFTGASYLFSAQEEKKAKSEIETISLSLKQFKSEHGDFPLAGGSESEEMRGKILFMSLSGWLDTDGLEIEKDERGKSFLASDSFTLGKVEDSGIESYTLTGEQLLGNIGEDEEIFMIDPWESPYVYEYPRSDGHSGFLLYSKGPDQQSSTFSTELTSTPDKATIDEDNIPVSEPGKW